MLIPKWNLNDLKAKLEKLNRRAAKLHMELFVLQELGTVTKEVGDEPKKLVDYVEVELSGPTLIIEGWTFVAKLEHTEAGSIVYNLTDTDIPVELSSRPACCEHCHKKVWRKDTFLLYNPEKKEWKQVGRQCLKDFLGFHGTPESILQAASVIEDFRGISAEEDHDRDCDDFYGGKSNWGYFRADTTYFLFYAATAIRLYGYMNRTEADAQDRMSTGEIAWSAYCDRKGLDEVCKKHEQQDKEVAWRTIDYINELPGNNDYERNLKALLKAGVSYQSAGMMASAIVSYKRTAERKAQGPALLDEYYGTVGKREVFELTYLGENTFDTQFGVMHIIRFKDAAGHLFVWKTTSPWLEEREAGQLFKVKGTIKEHADYKGTKQTVLSRVTLL